MLSRSFRIALLTGVSSVVVAAVIAPFALGGGAKDRQPATPPGGIYTCDWIAAHPAEAARAGVTCSPVPPPVMPGADSTLVDPTSIGRVASGPDSLLYTCFRLPSSGEVGQGVWAWSNGYPYTSYWDINSYFAHDYHWYIQNVGGTNVHVEHITDASIHSKSVGSNYHRTGAQNHASTAVHWQSCYD